MKNKILRLLLTAFFAVSIASVFLLADNATTQAQTNAVNPGGGNVGTLTPTATCTTNTGSHQQPTDTQGNHQQPTDTHGNHHQPVPAGAGAGVGNAGGNVSGQSSVGSAGGNVSGQGGVGSAGGGNNGQGGVGNPGRSVSGQSNCGAGIKVDRPVPTQCGGESCNGLDPTQLKCNLAGITTKTLTVTDYEGYVIGTVANVHSSSCNANWTEATITSTRATGVAIMDITKNAQQQTEYTCFPGTDYSVNQNVNCPSSTSNAAYYNGSTGWPAVSNMLAGPNVINACAFFTDLDQVRYQACINNQ
ncbi:hypothetical protein [Dictyobacter kobayashii]|uniref:SRCR domain-containing protein n=1 Tax=Dictyobacter kobayashii TaxID=2014872 RepID=A0A402AWF7_9CHLR|nr:hypothetical protein [Dictyobacter kobayashii]GCE23480.1 hypothetical protein KDK_72800 [Dictyobacter kobayashii]